MAKIIDATLTFLQFTANCQNDVMTIRLRTNKDKRLKIIKPHSH